MKLSQNTDSILIYNFLKKSLQPFRWHLFGIILITILCAVDISTRPYLLRVILNRLSAVPLIKKLDHIYFPIVCYIFMSAFIIFARRLQDIIRLILFPNLKKNIAQHILEYMMGQSYEYYQNHLPGSLSNKINDVVNGIPQILSIIIERFFNQILGLLIAVYTLSTVDIKFALIMIVWILMFLLFSLSRAKDSCLLSNIASEARSKMHGKIVDILTNMISVRFFGTKDYETQQFETISKDVVANEQRLQWFILKAWVVQGVFYTIVLSTCLWLLINGCKKGLITLGDFSLILTLNMYILDCLWNMGKELSDFTENLGKITQGLVTVSEKYSVSDVENATELQISTGKIQFKNVNFYYNQNVPLLFDNQNVTIHAQEKVGLVGYSGSGKSTFVNLLLRSFDVKSGQILIDNQDISMVTQESIMRAISIIPQEPFLFHRSLMENIRYGKIDANDNEVIAAAKKAHAHEFITLMPNEYNSLVGDRGVKLSGGQRQQIAIARAILKNSPILILDEATSALDSVTEGYVQQSLTKLMEHKTVIVIAHRLSTLLKMDRILVFDKGRIIEEGSHKDLLAMNAIYAKLWNHQVGGFLLDETD